MNTNHAPASSRPGFFSSFFVLFLVLSVALFGCSKKSEPRATSAAAAPSDTQSGTPAIRARAVTVDTTVLVRDVDGDARVIRDAVFGAGGYVADATISGDGDARVSRLELRVPAAALSPFLAKVASLGEVASYNERAEDVTDQRTDLKARLRNARAEEARMIEVMEKKTATLSEVFEAEKELARVREGIERLDAQDRTLDGRVELAVVHVSLETKTAEAWRTPGASIRRAAMNGAHAASAFYVTVAMAFATVLPTLLPLVLMTLATILLARAISRRRRAMSAPALQH